ncbi:MAG TPA: creatininase family protein [Candidatus Latescibacteria bacterium]|nr:creatininase family protein [Candidatus Latescibacterota bacterium]
MGNKPVWGRFEELRPDQLEQIVERWPVAYWPLGLIEHHGWALPVGFDGVKAVRFCERIAAATGGVVLPCLWWGSHGGHGDFKWTFYQDAVVGERVLDVTVRKLIGFGFRAIVLHAGHYPWQGVLDKVLSPVRDEHPEVLFIWGTECTIGGEGLRDVPGDHAARWETSYGLALLPDLVDKGALREGRGLEAWPNATPPPEERRYRGVVFDTQHPLFAQLGEDARKASAEEAEFYLSRIAEAITQRVRNHLER